MGFSVDDDDDDDDDNRSSTKGTKVLLPGDNFILQNWKSKPGSLVRMGEMIALASSSISVQQQQQQQQQDADAFTVSSMASATTTTTTLPLDNSLLSGAHKRPNRRQRAALPSATTTATATATATTQPNNNINHTSSSNPMESIKQRLAEKLSSSDKIAVSSFPLAAAAAAAVPHNKDEARKVPIFAPATGILRIVPDPKLSSFIIGFIEPCQHPASLDGLCVVCGMILRSQDDENVLDSDSDQRSNNNRSSPNVLFSTIPAVGETSNSNNSNCNSNMSRGASQMTVSGGITMTVSAAESRQIAQLETERLLQQAKLSLVLDLDHTLVHATPDPRAHQFHGQGDVRTLRLPMMEENNNNGAVTGRQTQNQNQKQKQQFLFMQHHVKLRPHIKTFLQNVQKDYELTVYTAGTRQYAEEITIVLCRHLVGSNRDIDDLERLRYQVQLAELEFQRLQSLNHNHQSTSTTTTPESESVDDNMSVDETTGRDTKKRKFKEASCGSTTREMDTETDSKDDEHDSPPPPPGATKRKRVSFGAPQDADAISSGDTNDSSSNSKPSPRQHCKSDHITQQNLDALRTELADAEELEKKAWECRQKLFGSRVVSRTDVGDLGRDVKSLKRIFPCGGTMAAVVDDREDVWANAEDNSLATIKGEPPGNLVLVRPYHWKPFIGFADVNNSAGEDLSGKGAVGNNGEDPNVEKDVQLVWTSRILKGLHRRFYRQDLNNRKTVPELLAQMRSQVLQDTTLVLSGLVPLHKKSIGANQARPPIVRYAESLGAKLVNQVVPGVTHVVAAEDGTDKCIAARKTPGCVLVRVAWLLECFWSMTCRDVGPHLLGGKGTASAIGVTTAAVKTGKNSNKQPLQESKLEQISPPTITTLSKDDSSEISSTGTSSDADDDLAAAFEDDMMES